MKIREFLKPHVEYEVKKAKINKCKKECKGYMRSCEIEELSTLLADFTNEAVKLADKLGRDRDEFMNFAVFVLSTVTATGSFDDYEIMAK